MSAALKWMLRIAAAALVLALLAFVALRLNRSSLDSDLPRAIAYNDESCSECRMQISDSHFSAQLITTAGDALSFDDPGCLLLMLTRDKPAARAIYFRHLHEERWLKAPAVGFVKVPHSPMGHNLGAVDASAAGAIPYATALERVRTHTTPQPEASR